MDIMRKHLALRINYLEQQIDAIPHMTVFCKNNKKSVSTKIRIRENGTILHTYDVSTSPGAELLRQHELRNSYIEEVKSLKSLWYTRWREPIPKVKKAALPCNADIRSPLLSAENYRKAEAYMNKAYPIKNGILYKDKLYRSKGEIRIASAMDALGLEFKYETSIDLGGHCLFPDFHSHSPETDNCAYIEYCGMLDDPNYYSRYIAKRQLYHNMGLREDVDIIFINEYKDLNISDEWIMLKILNALEFDSEFEEQTMSLRTAL